MGKCGQLVSGLKLALVDFTSLVPGAGTAAKDELTVAREGLEYAVMVRAERAWLRWAPAQPPSPVSDRAPPSLRALCRWR